MPKTFPGVRALQNVSLDLRAGEVHALMGENGAGKSTLMKILTGVYQPDAGEIRVRGEPGVRQGALVAAEPVAAQAELVLGLGVLADQGDARVPER